MARLTAIGQRAIRSASVLAVTMIAITACSAGGGSSSAPPSTTRVTAPGVVDYRKSHPEWLTRNHRTGHLTYQTAPPVGGDHNPVWQNCNGQVYAAPIANEHAVHSLEHGAVWITYRPDLPADQVALLATQVRDRPYLMMSPYPGLDTAVSVQAWGYQVKVDSAADLAVIQFIRSYRITAAPEPDAPCSGGTTATGLDAELT